MNKTHFLGTILFLFLFIIWTNTWSQCPSPLRINTNSSGGQPVFLYVVEDDITLTCRATASSEVINCTQQIRNQIQGKTIIVEINEVSCIYNCTDSCRISPITPVELSAFWVQSVNDKIFLKWITESEFNNDYFEIQKSYDALNWVVLDKVKGNGTTGFRNQYEFVYIEEFSGTDIYYRLKQVDYDSNFEYSPTISLYIYDIEETWFDIYGNQVDLKLRPQSGIYFSTRGKKKVISN